MSRSVEQQPQQNSVLDGDVRNLLDEALDKLPLTRKEAYLEATRRAPHLVATESPPERFLRFTSYKVKEAADMLAFYWESRKAIYGESRAFFPLTQTRSGPSALNEEDISFLENSRGCFAFLPNDANGGAVLYNDLSKECSPSPEICLRVAFYVWSILSENERCQTEGFTSIVGLSCPQKSDTRFKAAEEMVSVAIPVRFKSTYLLCCPGHADRKVFFSKVLPKVLLALEKMTEKREIVCVEDTAMELAEVMIESGFSNAGLPESVGGAWNIDSNFSEWQKQRMQLELDRYGRKMPPPVEQANQKKTASFLGTNDRDNESTPNAYPLGNLKLEVCDTAPFASASAVNKFPPMLKVSAEEMGTQKRQLLQELQEALLDIPRDQKQAFSEAVKRASHLVWNDPDPICFLNCEKNNAKAAARRWVDFWTLRQEKFGNRAFLPMNQTGHGALSPEDLEVLRSGYFQFLPPDDKGRQVALLQPKLVPPHLFRSSAHIRCNFYMNCVASENASSGEQGDVLLQVLDSSKLKSKPGDTGSFFHCSPNKWGSVHKLICHDPAETTMIQKTIVPFILKSDGVVCRVFVHTSVSPSELGDQLKEHGISASGLPSSVGGTWADEKFKVWQKERLAFEKQRDAFFLTALYTAST